MALSYDSSTAVATNLDHIIDSDRFSLPYFPFKRICCLEYLIVLLLDVVFPPLLLDLLFELTWLCLYGEGIPFRWMFT